MILIIFFNQKYLSGFIKIKIIVKHILIPLFLLFISKRFLFHL
jgi:hypothetical protein